MSDELEDDAKAIAVLMSALKPLDQESRVHVLEFVIKRLGVPLNAEAPAPARTASAAVIPTLPNCSLPAHSGAIDIPRFPAEKESQAVDEKAAVTVRYLGAFPGVFRAAERLRRDTALQLGFGAAIVLRLLFPFANSPFTHMYSDPARHWDNALNFFRPGLMGVSDPILYQLWLYLLQQFGEQNSPVILTATGVLCAMMPYGWYRALRELLPRRWALGGGLVMAVVPSFLSIYAYFMNKTLLLPLTGLAFWLTFRAQRKRSVAAFTWASAFWLAASFTRIVAIPMAIVCLATLWLWQPHKFQKALICIVLFCTLAIPAGVRATETLGYFAPFGNLYYNVIYRKSGMRLLDMEVGPLGHWYFGSPSYFNPTYYPFSDWTTDRSGTVFITIDPAEGRASWIGEETRVSNESKFSTFRDFMENLQFLCFGQQWPDNDLNTLSGLLNVWTRWIWLPLYLAVAYGAARGRFRGREWLLPICALGMFLLLVVQNSGIMEGRYRKPIDAVALAAGIVALYGTRRPRGVIAPQFHAEGGMGEAHPVQTS